MGPPRSGHRRGTPPTKVDTEEDPHPWKWTWKRTPPPEVDTEEDPPRSGCRRGGRGPAEKYCWASGRYALEKRLPCLLSFNF